MSDNKQSILIIDDNKLNVQAIIPSLMSMGLEISTMESGHNAVNNVSEIKPDLILLDILMPEIDGFEVCETLKAHESTREIPIIFLTSKNETENIVKGFDLGGADYVCKPFKRPELQARIKTHLKLQKETSIRKEREKELENTVKNLKLTIKENCQLKKLLPVCSSCKKIRDDEGYWKQIEDYLYTHTDVKFSHSLCPICAVMLYPNMAEKIVANLSNTKENDT